MKNFVIFGFFFNLLTMQFNETLDDSEKLSRLTGHSYLIRKL